MSSLLQFGGKCDKRGVRLEFYRTTPNTDDIANLGPIYSDSPTSGHDTDCIYMPGGKKLNRIWTAYRKPRGMFGCWVVFRINGTEQVPDLSCPIATFDLPRDVKPLPIAECIAAWNRS